MASSTLDGQVALVTGASRGIGRATAVALAEAGAAVAVAYGSNREAAEVVADEIRAAGARATTLDSELADSASAGISRLPFGTSSPAPPAVGPGYQREQHVGRSR